MSVFFNSFFRIGSRRILDCVFLKSQVEEYIKIIVVLLSTFILMLSLKGFCVKWRHSSRQLVSFWRHRWPEALAIADDHMARYPPAGLKQPNLDTRHLAEKVAMLARSKVRRAPPTAPPFRLWRSCCGFLCCCGRLPDPCFPTVFIRIYQGSSSFPRTRTRSDTTGCAASSWCMV